MQDTTMILTQPVLYTFYNKKYLKKVSKKVNLKICDSNRHL